MERNIKKLKSYLNNQIDNFFLYKIEIAQIKNIYRVPSFVPPLELNEVNSRSS